MTFAEFNELRTAKAKYTICGYCGRPLARNEGNHSCDGCGSALES